MVAENGQTVIVPLIFTFNKSPQTAAYFHPTSRCLGDAFEVPLENPSHCHGSDIHKVLQTHVINATGGQDNVGT